MKDTYKEKYEKSVNEYEVALNDAVVNDLLQQRFYSEKHMYTYDEIAKKYNISKAKVQKIAKNNNIKRRGVK